MKKKILSCIAVLTAAAAAVSVGIGLHRRSLTRQPGGMIGSLFNRATDNTWVFTGGGAVAGGFIQTRGERNYVGHFEEYIRWQQVIPMQVYGEKQWQVSQRFVTNTAADGQSLSAILVNRSRLIENLDPKAVAYMVGKEDYSKTDAAAVSAFQTQLHEFLDCVLSLRDGIGIAVIQLPYATADASANQAIETYIAAVRVVCDERDKKEQPRILLVDHYAQTRADAEFLQNGLHSDGVTLNETGHIIIGRQLCEATIGTAENYPSQDDDRSLTALDGSGLPLPGGDSPLPALQKAVAEKLANGRALTWLFAGDSITHGSQHTHGYDSVSQLFDKFLQSIGRDSDLVINAAVSGATSSTTIRQLDERLYRFQKTRPDIVILQLGTNSEGSDSEASPEFSDNIKAYIVAVRKINPEAIVLLCSPTEATPDSVFSQRAAVYGESMRTLAEQSGTFYLDRRSEMHRALTVYPWLAEQEEIFGDKNVHPGAVYHLAIFRDLVRAVGMGGEESPLLHLGYRVVDETKDVSATPVLRTTDHTLSVSAESCRTANKGRAFGEITLTAKDQSTGEIYTCASEETAVLSDLPDGTYTVYVNGIERLASRCVRFRSCEVTLGS